MRNTLDIRSTRAHRLARPESALTVVVAHLFIAPPVHRTDRVPDCVPNWRTHGSKGKKAGGSRLPCGSTYRLERSVQVKVYSRSAAPAAASACGTTEPTTVTIGLFGTFGYKEDGLYDAYKQVCPNITIKEDVIEQSADYWTRLKTHLASGSGLDKSQIANRKS